MTICGDTRDEPNEGFHAQITEITSAVCLFPPCLASATILDDEGSVSISNATVNEPNTGTATLTFNVTLASAAGTALTVNVSTADGTATGGTACSGSVDYITRNASVQFNVGDLTRPFTVDVCGDTRDEANETVLVNITSAPGALIADAQGQGTIFDNDPLPSLAISDAQVNENRVCTSFPCIQFSFLEFEVSLAPASGRTVAVDYATRNSTATNGTAAIGGADCTGAIDYRTTSGTLTFSPGDTSQSLFVQVCPDVVDELNEFLFMDLSNASNATVSDSAGTGRINNDDNPTVSIDDVSLREGSSGTKDFTFTVSLSHASLQDVTVNFATRDGTATVPSFTATCGAFLDYFPRSGSLTIPAGGLTGTIAVPVCGDFTSENTETFFVDLTLPIGEFDATIADGTGQGTIQNDDIVFDFGIASVATPNSVQVHDHVLVDFGWLLPPPTHWRQLQSLDLRLRNGSDIALWVRWDEATNEFRLFNTSSGRFGPPGLPGDPNVLASRGAKLHLDSTQAIGSGLTGSSVTLLLDLSFQPSAAGTYVVEVAAVDDTGHRDDFAPVGTLTVSR